MGGTRHLPGPEKSIFWSMRSRSEPPIRYRRCETPKNDMHFGECFPNSASQNHELHKRDWSAHIRLQCDYLEVLRKPEGDEDVLLFANRFLELRKVERMQRECKGSWLRLRPVAGL